MRPRGSLCRLWKNWSTHDLSEGASACTGPCCWPWQLGPPGTFSSRPKRWWKRRWRPSQTEPLLALWDRSLSQGRRNLRPETHGAAGPTRRTFAWTIPRSPPGKDERMGPRSRTFCPVRNPDWGRISARNRYSLVRGRWAPPATRAEQQKSKTETRRGPEPCRNHGNRGFFERTWTRPTGSPREPRRCAAASGTFGPVRLKSGNYLMRWRPAFLPNEHYSHWLRSLSMIGVLINLCC